MSHTKQEVREEAVDRTLGILQYHKEAAIVHLFCDLTDGCKAEWQRRDPMEFWEHLSGQLRRDLIDFALYYYKM